LIISPPRLRMLSATNAAMMMVALKNQQAATDYA
jgi:hypothetical protein